MDDDDDDPTKLLISASWSLRNLTMVLVQSRLGSVIWRFFVLLVSCIALA